MVWIRMAQAKNEIDVQLPENLKRQFTALERRLWKVETAETISIAVIALIVSFFVLLFSDRLWNSPIWFRVAISLFGLLCTIAAAFRWIRVWIVKRRDLRALANLVQRRFRRLGDRLLGIVELSNEKDRPAHFSPELYRAAIQQVAEEAVKFDFREAVDRTRAKRLLIVGGVVSLFLLLVAIFEPQLSANVFKRWIAPTAKIGRYTVVELVGLPSQVVVPHGEGFPVEATVRYRSHFWRPSSALAFVRQNQQIHSKANAGKLRFDVPGQMQNGVLKVKMGDAQYDVTITPAYRPALKQLTATVLLPEYLGYPATEEKIQSGSISVLEGSEISFRGKMSRALGAAWFKANAGFTDLQVNGDEFASEPQRIEQSTALSFLWRDNLGLSNGTPWQLSVQTTKDQPPAPDLPDLGRDVAILQGDVLDLRTTAKDDFGVRELGVSWQSDAQDEPAGDIGTTEMRLEKNSRREKRIEDRFRWSPAIFSLPPDTSVELVAFATDFFPERERVESSVHRIHILGNEKHAELVRQNLESVLARVEEVSRQEEKIFAKTGELQEQIDAEAEKGKAADGKNSSTEKAGKLSEEQAQNSKALDELAKEGMQALREAMKNPVFTEKALQDWAKTMNEMQKLAEGQMKQASQNLKSAQQQSGDNKAQQQNLANAQKQEEEALKALEQIQGKVNKSLDDLQALTLSERLRRVAGIEAEISGELKKIIPDTIGMLPQELPERFKRVNRKLAEVQDNTQKETDKLQREINRFFERTQKENYGEVSKEMKDVQTSDELDRLRGLVADNVAMEASRNLAVWNERFNKWAEKLQPPPSEDSDGSGGGGEGGQQEMNMTKTLIALLRLREKEMGLHSQTRLLDQERGTKQNYEARSKEILATQQQVTSGVKDLEKGNKIPLLVQPYKEAIGALAQAETFLSQPQTSQATLDVQYKGVEALTDAINIINEQAKRNPPPQNSQNQNNSAEEMAFLMQQMAPSIGQQQGMTMKPGGGNTGGGTTGRQANTATGDGTGKGGESRTVGKASGAAGIAIPSEFRETLESYYKALEHEARSQ